MFRIIPDVVPSHLTTRLDTLVRAASTDVSAQTAHGDRSAKRCRTVPYESPEGQQAAEIVATCLRSSQPFLTAALPTFTTTPRLVAYDTGHGCSTG